MWCWWLVVVVVALAEEVVDEAVVEVEFDMRRLLGFVEMKLVEVV